MFKLKQVKCYFGLDTFKIVEMTICMLQGPNYCTINADLLKCPYSLMQEPDIHEMFLNDFPIKDCMTFAKLICFRLI